MASRNTFSERLQAIVDTLQGDDHAIAVSLFLGCFEPIEDELTETGRFTFCDALENCIRNVSLFVMESLLLSDRAARRTNSKKSHAKRGTPKRVNDLKNARKEPQWTSAKAKES
ncbi:hypothetical protein D3C75_1125310 [compost metagenome]